jgi:glycosyltransferase involved in cell wall biosynthesis
MLKIDIAIFAHNEEQNIVKIIEQISLQNILYINEYSINVTILANGCTDNTVEVAIETVINLGLEQQVSVVDLPKGGKSRTWNYFVHTSARLDADILVFCDSDIWFVENDVLKKLCDYLFSNELIAVSSKPVKDITLNNENLSFIEKFIASSGGGLNKWQTSICGQLYALKAEFAKSLFLPLGLPVEDGFVRAMVATNNMTSDEDLSKLSGLESIYHVYRSERTIRHLIRHQVRIVIGSAINTVIYDELRNISKFDKKEVLSRVSVDEHWLKNLVSSKLPSIKYGWVPWSFLFKRVRFFFSQKTKFSFKKLLVLFAGFCFDAVVFVLAQLQMARGKGVGYW